MTTIPERLRHIYQTAPEQTAVRLLHNQLPDQVLTYRDLLHNAAGYANALGLAGIQPGEVVILILQHGQDLVTSFFGAILHGAVPSIMPFLTEKLSPEQYRRSLSALFEITRPAAVVTYPEFLSEVQAAISAHSSIRSLLLCTEVQPVPDLDPLLLAGFRTQTRGYCPAAALLGHHWPAEGCCPLTPGCVQPVELLHAGTAPG
jgi:fatty-acyl-CoA synthase